MNFKNKSFHMRSMGFTLVEVMVGLGIVVAGMLAMTKVVNTQSKSNQRTLIYAEAAQAVNDISILLENSEACRNSIIGAGPLTSPSQLNTNLATLSDSAGNTQFSEGSDYANGKYLQITDIRSVAIPGYTNFLANQEFAFNIAIDLTPKAQYSSAFGATITKILPDRVYLDINGAATPAAIGCLNTAARLLAEMKEESCISFGGVYGVVNNNPAVWCTLPGNNAVAGVAGRLDPTGLALNVGAAKDYVDDATSAPYLNYIRTTDPSGSQAITNGSLVFNGLGSMGNSGVIVSTAQLGNYSRVRLPSNDPNYIALNEFEKRVPNYQWLQTNLRDMLRHGTIGGSGNGSYCDESDGNLVLLDSLGRARCVSMSNLSCGVSPTNGSPEYFNGIDQNGNAICVPLIAGTTNCPYGGELIQNSNGTLEFVCGGTATCTPSGTWGNNSIDSYSCFCDGTSKNIERCEANCGGTCSGGAIEGAVRVVNGTCIAPSYCGSGGPIGIGSGSTSGSSSSSGSSCVNSCNGTARYRDLCNCCPANYPNTGTNYGCCRNNSGQEICL